MRLLESTHMELEWSDIARRVRHPLPGGNPIADSAIEKRSPGIHLSGVLRYIAIQTKMLQLGRQDDNEDLEVMPLRMVLGMAWEEMVVGLYPEMLWQPGELELDGVYMSRDGVSLLDLEEIPGWKPSLPNGSVVLAVEECKFTQKSARRPIESEWMWLQQCRGYCKGQEAATGEECRWARLHVCYVNGEYEWVRGGNPKYMRYLVEFERRELDATWKMVKDNKDKEGVVHEG